MVSWVVCTVVTVSYWHYHLVIRDQEDNMTTPDSSADSMRELTDRELLEELAETDNRLASLQHEIRRRMQQRAEYELRAEQHAEISRMVEHLDQARIDWHKVREFFRDTFVEVQESWRAED